MGAIGLPVTFLTRCTTSSKHALHAFALRLSAIIVGLVCVGLWLRRKIDTRSELGGVLRWVQVAMGQRMWSCKTCPNLSEPCLPLI